MNFAAWWGGGKLLVAAAAVAFVPMFAAKHRAVPLLFYWAVAIGLAYLSADKVLMLHERITAWNKENELGLPMFRGENGAWIGVYLVLFLFLILLFFRRIIIATRADTKSATLFGSGIVLFILGAVVGEIAGYYDFLCGRDSPLQLAIEEGLELVGVSFLLLGCIRHALLASQTAKVSRARASSPIILSSPAQRGYRYFSKVSLRLPVRGGGEAQKHPNSSSRARVRGGCNGD